MKSRLPMHLPITNHKGSEWQRRQSLNQMQLYLSPYTKHRSIGFGRIKTETMTYPDHPAFANNFQDGLTKREYFAAMAMQGYIASYTGDEAVPTGYAAEMSVKYADALIAALNKQPDPETDQL